MAAIAVVAILVMVGAFLTPILWRVGMMLGRYLADKWEWRLIGGTVITPETAQPKQVLTQPQSQAQDERKPKLNSAQARMRVEQMNAPFFSADKQRPNSEVLKEYGKWLK